MILLLFGIFFIRVGRTLNLPYVYEMSPSLGIYIHRACSVYRLLNLTFL